MIDVIWDMETGDPDDFLTLLLLMGHPEVNLKAVTITPGSPQQIGLVRKALALFNIDIPVGAHHKEHPKPCVSKWHTDVYGDIPTSQDAENGGEVLRRYCDSNTTLITGGPLKNLGAAIKLNFQVDRWIAQGGFAGEGVVPSELQLDKFKGMTTCPTYNLNGDSKSALAALSYEAIRVKRFVSKNVCHRVYYDRKMHDIFQSFKHKSLSLALIWKGMDAYLRHHPDGKKLHDPLAACCAIDESIATWAEVEIYREKGQWGARLSPGSGTWIIIDYNPEKFISTLTAY
ncbi:nucleoside hydrolase [Aerosakkonema sp. BLCC-F183]|uniref:nucleoside hydrolase n=1 Tax=Aerosakkonema sp. BLCC-F183 TaxID=3342834 RepID=UPI0035BA8733